MNKEVTKTNKRCYEIHYTTQNEYPSVWHVSNSAPDGGVLFKSYVEACKKVRELIETSKNDVSEYRVVEHDISVITEVLKNFSVSN